jgi:hypothetical protein
MKPNSNHHSQDLKFVPRLELINAIYPKEKKKGPSILMYNLFKKSSLQ